MPINGQCLAPNGEGGGGDHFSGEKEERALVHL